MTCGTYLRLARSYQCLIRSAALSSVPQRIVAVRTNARRKALAHSLADPTQRLQRVPARVLRCGISHSPPEPLTIVLHQASTEGVREYARTGSTLTDLARGLPTQLGSPWDANRPSTVSADRPVRIRSVAAQTPMPHGPRRVGLGFVAHLVHSAAVTALKQTARRRRPTARRTSRAAARVSLQRPPAVSQAVALRERACRSV
jgi:hypothetical protein